jgi:hypothetical protein
LLWWNSLLISLSFSFVCCFPKRVYLASVLNGSHMVCCMPSQCCKRYIVYWTMVKRRGSALKF